MPCKFDLISGVVNGFVIAMEKDYEYFYDTDGNLVTEKGYYDCHPFSSNRAAFRDPSTLLCGFLFTILPYKSYFCLHFIDKC